MAQNVYKIVGVHYTSLLDFLHAKGLKYGKLEDYFRYVTGTGKELVPAQTELMSKVANTVWAVQSLRTTAITFWQNYKRNNNALRSILIVMMVLVGLLVIIIYYKKEAVREDLSGSAKIKVVLVYLIISLIAYAFLVVMMMGIASKVSQGKNMINEVSTDFQKFNVEIMSLPEDVRLSLLLMLYVGRQNNGYTKVQYDQLLSYVNNSKVEGKVFDRQRFDDIFSKQKGNAVSVDRNILFHTIKGPLQSTLLGFYDNGNGYLNMKKIIVSSNAIMMIREMKSTLTFYYSVIQKGAPQLDGEQDDEKNKKVINLVVLPEFNKLNLSKEPNRGEDMDVQTKKTLFQQNMEDNDTAAYFDDLVKQLCYFGYFVYPIFKGLNPLDPSFPISGFTTSMPQNEDISKIIYQDMKDTYGAVFQSEYASYLQQATSAEGYAEKVNIIGDMFDKHFKSLFKQLFLDASYTIEGEYIFIYDKELMKTQMKSKFASSTPFTTIRDGDFVEAMVSAINFKVMDTLWDEYKKDMKSGKQLDTLKNDIVSDVSTGLVTTEIKTLTRYRQYIFEQLKDPAATPTYADLIVKIDKELLMKRATNTGNIFQSTDTTRFINPDDFVDRLDKLTFLQIYTGFKTGYLLDIVNSFYVKISNGTNSKSKTLSDIYYAQDKTLAQVKTLLWFLGTILILGYIYYLRVMFDDKAATTMQYHADKKDVSQQENSDMKLYIINKQHSNYILAWYMKTIAMGVSMFFLLMLIISFYRKAVAKFEFNKETIEANTSDFKNAIDSLNTLMEDIWSRVGSNGGSNAKMNTTIGKLLEITAEDKEGIYKNMIAIVDKYEKCNYITIASKTTLPFPYTEVTMDLFMLIVVIFVLFYISKRIKPLERITKIKELRHKRERAEMGDMDEEMIAELNEYYTCHMTDMDGLMFAVKIIVFMFIIMFLIFYSSLIISSSNEFRVGLYNSMYFEQSRCYDM